MGLMGLTTGLASLPDTTQKTSRLVDGSDVIGRKSACVWIPRAFPRAHQRLPTRLDLPGDIASKGAMFRLSAIGQEAGGTSPAQPIHAIFRPYLMFMCSSLLKSIHYPKQLCIAERISPYVVSSAVAVSMNHVC